MGHQNSQGLNLKVLVLRILTPDVEAVAIPAHPDQGLECRYRIGKAQAASEIARVPHCVHRIQETLDAAS